MVSCLQRSQFMLAAAQPLKEEKLEAKIPDVPCEALKIYLHAHGSGNMQSTSAFNLGLAVVDKIRSDTHL